MSNASNSTSQQREQLGQSASGRSKGQQAMRSGRQAPEQQAAREDFQVLIEEVGRAVRDYSNRRPGVAGGVLFAVGFFIGWRLKPW